MDCEWWFDSMEKILFLVLWKLWTHTAYEFIFDEFIRPVESMNSYCIWIHIRRIQYEFIYFSHFKYMNSYEYEFILCMNSYTFCSYHVWIRTFLQYEFSLCMNSYTFCSYHVWIHIFFAVQNKSCERAQAASAQRELQGQSPSSPPAPTRPHRLPRPLGLRAAAPIVRVACGCPDS